jgi:hypothetical protein
MMNKAELHNRLRKSDQVVTFTKADGTTRVLKCTLNIPVKEESGWLRAVFPPRAVRSDDVAVVWDKEIKDWRSFRFDSVIEIKDDDSRFGLLQE